MLLFKDLFHEDKIILTDSYPMKLIDDFVWEVQATYTKKSGDNFGDELFGGNPSAEEACEGVDDAQEERGFDVILNSDVEEFPETPDYKKFMKSTMKKIIATSKSKMDPERFAIFKEKCTAFFTKGQGCRDRFANFQIFFCKDNIDLATGDILACPIFIDADDTGMKAKIYFFKDLMIEEKA